MNLPARRGIALTVIGPILMLIFAPAALGIGVWRGVVASNDRLDAHPWVQVGQSVQIGGGQPQSIVVSDVGVAPAMDCSVAGPTGPVDVHPVPYDDGGIGASSYLEIAYFDPDASGAYQVDCGVGPVKVISTQVLVGADDAFGVPLVLGLCVAGVFFVVGGTLLIVGIVKLVRSSQERQRALLARAGYGYGPYQGPYQGPTYGVPPLAPYQNDPREQLPAMGDPKDPFAPPTERTP